MMLVKEKGEQQGIFDAVLETIRERHPESTFLNDPSSSPLLFKSADEKIWVRIFYSPAAIFSSKNMSHEFMKLKLLMPKDALFYFFYPKQDGDPLAEFRASHRNLLFYDYERSLQQGKEKLNVRCLEPLSSLIPALKLQPKPVVIRKKQAPLLAYARLSSDEIAELNNIGLNLAVT